MSGSAMPFSGLFFLCSPPLLVTILLLKTTAWCTLPLANHSPVTWSKCRLVCAVHYNMFASCTYLPQAIGFLTLFSSLTLQHGQENALIIWPCQNDSDVCKQCYTNDCSISYSDLQRLYGGRAKANGGSRLVLLNTLLFPLLTEHQQNHSTCKSNLLKHGWRSGMTFQSTMPMI